MINEELLGKCGFYCGSCPTYRNNDCTGCLKAHRAGDCFTRDCVLEKELLVCPICKDFPCHTILTKEKSTVLDKDWMRWKAGNKQC